MLSLTAGLILGFVGSLHCLGMCGPIALTIPKKGKGKYSILLDGLIYNLGRVFTYSILGLLIGLFGSSFVMAGVQTQFSLALGILILLGLLLPQLKKKINIQISILTKISSWFKARFSSLLKSKNRSSLFLLGVFNGLLPCGLVYLALSSAFATGTLLGSVELMAGFGLGTIPMMYSIYLSGKIFSLNFKKYANKLVPISMGIVAIFLILRGLSLDIDYISPQLPDDIINERASCCEDE